MNALATYIQSANLTGKPAEIVAALDADGDAILDTMSYSLSGLADQLKSVGVDIMVLIDLRSHIATLPIGGNTLEGLLITGGGDAGGVVFSRDDIRTQIQYNQKYPSTTDAQQAVLAGMLLVGIMSQKKWQQAGLASLPTEEQVAIALQQIADEPWDGGSSIRGRLHNLRNTILNLFAAIGSDTLTKAEAAAICDMTEIDRLVAEIKAEIA